MDEVCSLIRGYVDWLSQRPPPVRRLAGRDDCEARVAVAGATVREALAVAEAMRAANVQRVHLDLVCPLGDLNRPYEALLKRSGSGSSSGAGGAGTASAAAAAAALEGELRRRGVSGVSVGAPAGVRGCGDLEDGAYDLVVLAPLAFGVVDAGAGAFNGAARARAACVALEKTKVGLGHVLLCARERVPWQLEVFQDRIDCSLVEQLRLALAQERVGGAGLSAHTVSFRSELRLTEAQLGDLDALLQVNSYNSYGSSATALSPDAALRAVRGAQAKAAAAGAGAGVLEERGTLFVATWAGSPSLAPRRAEAKLAGVDADADADAYFVAAAQEASGEAFPDLVADPKAWWPNGLSGEFVNVGQELWERQRLEWARPRHTGFSHAFEDRGPAPAVRYEEVIAGLASLRRTYDLPHPMKLSEVVDIYLDVWETQDGY
jgi:hypothetical protein